MRLNESDGWRRVALAEHGVLGTLHAERGVDLVPVVYAIDEEHAIFVPVDTVKPKATTRLQRVENIRNDPRCTLLVEHYDTDWSRLWWVRIIGEGREAVLEDLERFLPLLANRFPPYADPTSIAGGLLIRPLDITGWAAG